jgi:peptide-methionine (R)-S-oxide reductase
MTDKVHKPDEEWARQLTHEQFHVTRRKGTERAFTGTYWNEHRDGVYRCICCDAPLFDASTKFDSGSGWPSFTSPVDEGSVAQAEDESYGMHRTEVVCARCDAHLGHVFPDGPQPTGLRYCINSTSLRLECTPPGQEKPGEPRPATDRPGGGGDPEDAARSSGKQHQDGDEAGLR